MGGQGRLRDTRRRRPGSISTRMLAAHINLTAIPAAPSSPYHILLHARGLVLSAPSLTNNPSPFHTHEWLPAVSRPRPLGLKRSGFVFYPLRGTECPIAMVSGLRPIVHTSHGALKVRSAPEAQLPVRYGLVSKRPGAIYMGFKRIALESPTHPVAMALP